MLFRVYSVFLTFLTVHFQQRVLPVTTRTSMLPVRGRVQVFNTARGTTYLMRDDGATVANVAETIDLSG